MFERFTESARKVFALSNQYAERYNDEFIRPEHLVLALVQAGGANDLLSKIELTPFGVREGILEKIKIKPELVRLGKLPQSPDLKQVVEYSIQTARNLGSNYVGIEHLLCGVLRAKPAILSEALSDPTVSQPALRQLEWCLRYPEAKNLEENTQAPELPEDENQVYWKIPAGSIPLEKLLDCFGYTVANSVGSTKVVYMKSSIPVGSINDGSKITVTYSLDKSSQQIKEALELRKLLDTQNISYTEEPSREELVRELRKKTDETQSLVQLLRTILDDKNS